MQCHTNTCTSEAVIGSIRCQPCRDERPRRAREEFIAELQAKVAALGPDGWDPETPIAARMFFRATDKGSTPFHWYMSTIRNLQVDLGLRRSALPTPDEQAELDEVKARSIAAIEDAVCQPDGVRHIGELRAVVGMLP